MYFMGKCDRCGKKYPFLGGYTDKGKHYCPECFKKKRPEYFHKETKPQEEKLQKTIKKEEDKKTVKNNWSYSMGLILIALLVFWSFGFFDTSNEEYTDYTYCVDNCVSDINDCVFFEVVYDNQRTAWVEWDNYDLCSLDLEICVSDCKSDYDK